MKKTLISLTLLTAVTAGAAMAQVPPPGEDPMGGKTVTKAEAAAKAAEMFAKMDVNNDGKIDQADRAAHRAQMFDQLDTNKDGTISRDEFAAAHSGKDGDAKGPDGHRMGQRWSQMGGAMMMLRMADANKDGVVTRDEFLAAAARMFDMADANKDGKLTPEERKAHHAQMRQKMGRMRGAGGHAGHTEHPASN